jgi:hypothetical protein
MGVSSVLESATRRIRAILRATLAAGTVAAVAGGVLATSGCSVDINLNNSPGASASASASAPPPAADGPAVRKDALDRELAQVIEQRVGQRPDQVSCPGDLPRIIGSKVECAIIKSGQRLGTVTVVLTDGGHVTYHVDMEVPSSSPAAPGSGS